MDREEATKEEVLLAEKILRKHSRDGFLGALEFLYITHDEFEVYDMLRYEINNIASRQ